MTDQIRGDKRTGTSHALAIDAAMFDALRRDLLASAPSESAAFLLVRPVLTVLLKMPP